MPPRLGTGATPAIAPDSSSEIDDKGKRHGTIDTPLARVDRCPDALVGPRCKDAVGRVANEALVPVDVIGDTLGEENEVFYLEIRGTGDADLVSQRCRAIIEDDDLPLVWIESAVEVQEPDSCVSSEGYAGVSDEPVVATCRIHASASRVPSVNVAWGTKDGTAQAPQDYLPDSRRVAFGSLTELLAKVTIERDDDFEESDETFFIEIRSVENAVRDEARSSCQVMIKPGSMLGGCGGY